MTNDNTLKLSDHILKSLRGAWELSRANPKAMQYFDLSSDGFWKSFWALGVMMPVYLLWAVFNIQTEPQTSGPMVSYPLLSESIFFLSILPITAFVMVYFTKFMKISENYALMVIAFNWVNALVFCLVTIATIILGTGLVGEGISFFILVMLKFYFTIYVVWFTLKISLGISGLLAAGVFLFISLLNACIQVLLLMVFNPDYFEAVFAAVNIQPA